MLNIGIRPGNDQINGCKSAVNSGLFRARVLAEGFWEEWIDLFHYYVTMLFANCLLCALIKLVKIWFRLMYILQDVWSSDADAGPFYFIYFVIRSNCFWRTTFPAFESGVMMSCRTFYDGSVLVVFSLHIAYDWLHRLLWLLTQVVRSVSETFVGGMCPNKNMNALFEWALSNELVSPSGAGSRMSSPRWERLKSPFVIWDPAYLGATK